jgi:hypothetical protein
VATESQSALAVFRGTALCLTSTVVRIAFVGTAAAAAANATTTTGAPRCVRYCLTQGLRVALRVYYCDAFLTLRRAFNLSLPSASHLAALH